MRKRSVFPWRDFIPSMKKKKKCHIKVLTRFQETSQVQFCFLLAQHLIFIASINQDWAVFSPQFPLQNTLPSHCGCSHCLWHHRPSPAIVLTQHFALLLQSSQLYHIWEQQPSISKTTEQQLMFILPKGILWIIKTI